MREKLAKKIIDRSCRISKQNLKVSK